MIYTVRKLAAISGVSVRTLHYYDEVDLLKPAYHGNNGYRYYEEEQLLLLQQILFYRRLGFELQKIREVLKKKDFDRVAALHSHRKLLLRNLEETQELIQTIDRTIEHIQGKKKMKHKDIFEGLNDPKQKEYEKYLIDHGKMTAEELDQGRKRLGKWSKEDWQKTQEEWEQLLQDYVKAIDKGPGSPEARDLVRRHLLYLKKFGVEVKMEKLAEESKFYLGHPDWKKLFDGYHPQLQEFILSAIEEYAK
ncbi:MAG: MerR family transcriptional regulator [Verrucomicrobia bacterium]|nr:MerR family transcriptional regulator [Verrucomicrobiota bacterium]